MNPALRSRPPIMVNQKMTRHDQVQNQLYRASQENPELFAMWLSKYIPEMKDRIPLTPLMKQTALHLRRAIDAINLKGMFSGILESADIQVLESIWASMSVPMLQEKLDQLEKHKMAVSMEMPITSFSDTLSPLNRITPPQGYVDIVVDIDAPYLDNPDGRSRPAFHTIGEYFDWLLKGGHDLIGAFRYQYLCLPVGFALKLQAKDRARVVERIVNTFASNTALTKFRESWHSMIKARLELPNMHEFLFLEIKTGNVPADSLIAQMSKYTDHDISGALPSREEVSPIQAGIRSQTRREIPAHQVRQCWDYGIGLGDDWNSAVNLVAPDLRVSTIPVAVFPNKYAHKKAVLSGGFYVIDNVDRETYVHTTTRKQ